MEIIDVERIPSHSGSIRVYAAFKGAHSKAASVKKLLALEKHKALHTKETLIYFTERVYGHRNVLLHLLTDLKKSGKRIVGIGAPAKGNTLLNFCGITPEVVDCLFEKSDLKIGLYAPGTHIPVMSEALLYEEQPEFALLLSWNLADEIISKLRKHGYRGKFIIPFPKILIV
jgi:hypothetical protein